MMVFPSISESFPMALLERSDAGCVEGVKDPTQTVPFQRPRLEP